MTRRSSPDDLRITLGRPHTGQIKAHNALCRSRFAILRCGRRFGKTEYARKWIASDPRVSSVLTATHQAERAQENAEAGSAPFFTPDQRALVVRIAQRD